MKLIIRLVFVLVIFLFLSVSCDNEELESGNLTVQLINLKTNINSFNVFFSVTDSTNSSKLASGDFIISNQTGEEYARYNNEVYVFEAGKIIDLFLFVDIDKSGSFTIGDLYAKKNGLEIDGNKLLTIDSSNLRSKGSLITLLVSNVDLTTYPEITSNYVECMSVPKYGNYLNTNDVIAKSKFIITNNGYGLGYGAGTLMSHGYPHGFSDEDIDIWMKINITNSSDWFYDPDSNGPDPIRVYIDGLVSIEIWTDFFTDFAR